MSEILIALAPLFSILATIWIAINQIIDQTCSDAREVDTARISVWAAALALFSMLGLDIIALLNGEPGQIHLGEWFSSGDFVIRLSFTLDTLGLVMGTLVALLVLMTMRFSVNYMHREAGFHRFFITMNLFSSAMMLIVLGGNVVMVFVGWELAGLSSYLLIAYAIDRPVATRNATRAFVTNRIGDAGFIFGIALCYIWIGDSEWDVIATQAGQTSSLVLVLIATGFIIAALAKSAQVPFSPWIAHALEGPTPSSAIFYGALMVHAGVYLLIRLEPLLIQAPGAMMVITVLGSLTAVYGWLSGLVQSDVKSSLIFSTTTQVGLMFIWCGLGWFDIASWHIGLHACWRAYQFLHAPSLMQLVSRAARPAPGWLTANRWLYSAAIQRFWLAHIGDAMVSRPMNKLANDAQAFEEQVVNPLVGLPAQARAISSMAQWEDRKDSAIEFPEGGVGGGTGVAGKLFESIANALHWFEEHLVLKGGGEGLLKALNKIGNYFTHIDRLLSHPRYLLLMIAVTFIIIL